MLEAGRRLRRGGRRGGRGSLRSSFRRTCRFVGDFEDRSVAVHKLNSAYMCLCLCTKQFLLPAGKAE